MSSPIVTPGSVTSAAEAVVALGEKPTVDRIRAYLQGGSPNKILPLLRDWKAANQQPRTDTGAEQPRIAAPEPVREIVTLETLPEVTGAIEALTHAILDVLSRVQSSERARATAIADEIQTVPSGLAPKCAKTTMVGTSWMRRNITSGRLARDLTEPFRTYPAEHPVSEESVERLGVPAVKAISEQGWVSTSENRL